MIFHKKRQNVNRLQLTKINKWMKQLKKKKLLIDLFKHFFFRPGNMLLALKSVVRVYSLNKRVLTQLIITNNRLLRLETKMYVDKKRFFCVFFLFTIIYRPRVYNVISIFVRTTKTIFFKIILAS